MAISARKVENMNCELTMPTTADQYFALNPADRSEVNTWMIQELRKRQPSEEDLKTIAELKKQDWKATQIASGIEMEVKTVRKVIKGLDIRPETPEQRMDLKMRGRVLMSGGEQI
jgi:hypothetical protein